MPRLAAGRRLGTRSRALGSRARNPDARRAFHLCVVCVLCLCCVVLMCVRVLLICLITVVGYVLYVDVMCVSFMSLYALLMLRGLDSGRTLHSEGWNSQVRRESPRSLESTTPIYTYIYIYIYTHTYTYIYIYITSIYTPIHLYRETYKSEETKTVIVKWRRNCDAMYAPWFVDPVSDPMT